MGHLNYYKLSILATIIFYHSSTQSAVPHSPPLLQSNSSDLALHQSNPLNSSSSQTSGSNFAGYNEPCTGGNTPGRMCNDLQNLACDNSVCKCKPNVSTPDAPLIFAGMYKGCLPIATAKDFWACSDDSQCTNAKYGKYSRCNTAGGTGFSGRCECFDTEGQGRETFLIEDTCYVKKIIGESCGNDMECNATIVGEAICQGSGISNKKGVCQCADKFHFEPNYRECLKLGTLHSVCKSDTQCKHEEALGPLSRCQEPSKTCDCWDTEEFGKKDTKFHEGRCYFSRGVNQTCTSKLECNLGYHKDADCLEHESYNGEKVCQCSPGAACKGSGSTFSGSILLITLCLFSFVYYSK